MGLGWEGRFEQMATLLPRHLRQRLLLLPQAQKEQAEEIRLRVGRPVTLNLRGREQDVPGDLVTENDLRLILEIASQASIHTVLDKLCCGFLTVNGGHRIGICGSAVMREGKIESMRMLTSMAIRVAKEIRGISTALLPALFEDGTLQNTLILAPPGQGKTTLLRDVIRGLSDGAAAETLRVGVVDERGELAAVYRGCPQMDLGAHTDILDGCPKREGLLLLLRGMNPQVLAVDEITAQADIEAMLTAAGCGVALIATAHGRTPQELARRPVYRALLEEKLFRRFISISTVSGEREYQLWDGEKRLC